MSERSADMLDQASDLQEKINQSGRAQNERALAPQKHPDFDGVHCVEEDCGEDLPPIRIVMGRIRCTPCQVAADKRLKQQGR